LLSSFPLWWRVLLRVLGIHDPQPPHQLRQSLPRNPELARRLHAATAAACERGANEVLFEHAPRLIEAPCVRDWRLRKHRRQCRHRHDTTAAGADDERREHVLQLTDIPWPVVLGERRDDWRAERRPTSAARGRLAPDVFCQNRNVLTTIAKRRHRDA